jgi:pyruvate/2-oxoglutarate dehydrogenase complex dihydrolipoamide dehydrogenase (E3) component
MEKEYDLVVLGAGSGGLTAAEFAAKLGARVALVEKSRIGGDCTWTGCVPSKALLKAAKAAHDASRCGNYGVKAAYSGVDMAKVRDYIRGAIQRVYASETPEVLAEKGVEVVFGAGRFLDPHTIAAGDRRLSAKKVLLTTGARPAVPVVEGLDSVPYQTYESIFENDSLPRRLIIVGGGPIGTEVAQAYRRLGSEVTIVARSLLPKEEPQARECIEGVFAHEGVRIVRSHATAARLVSNEIVLTAGAEVIRADLLLIATGRIPNISGLDLEKAGVHFASKSIPVDDQLRTNVKHVYAAGDVLGGQQFTHFAGWQAFQAVRNALLPGHSSGVTSVVPRVTFTAPEVAQAGLTEEHARAQLGDDVEVRTWEMTRADRAICDGDEDGFVKVITQADGTIVGATIVAARAGEAIMELVHAIQHKWKMSDLAGAIHPYPTYSTAVQQLAADMAVERFLAGASGKLMKEISKLIR